MDHQQMVLGVKWLQLNIDMPWRFSACPYGSEGRRHEPESSLSESVFGMNEFMNE